MNEISDIQQFTFYKDFKNIESFIHLEHFGKRIPKGSIVNIEGNVNLSAHSICDFENQLGYKLGKVLGCFSVRHCDLENMNGFPTQVGDGIILDDNELVSLENIPLTNRSIQLCSNKISSLKFCQKIVQGQFDLKDNKLTSLEYGPQYVYNDYDVGANLLESLDHVAPIINGSLRAPYNRIKSLVGISTYLKNCQFISIQGNPIEEGGIGLIFVDNLVRVESSNCGRFSEASEIIHKYLRTGKSGLLPCANELEEAGLGAFAKL